MLPLSSWKGSPRFPYLLKSQYLLSTCHYIIAINEFAWLISWETIRIYIRTISPTLDLICLKFSTITRCVNLNIYVCNSKTNYLKLPITKIKYIFFKYQRCCDAEMGVGKKDKFKLQIALPVNSLWLFFNLWNI